MKIAGTVESGVGKGAYFTQLPWFVEQIRDLTGFSPFPGTLNIKIAEQDFNKFDAFFGKKDIKLVPDNPEFCTAWLKKVWINGIPGVAVFPEEKVRIHEKTVVEVIAEHHLKKLLHLRDGDQVVITDSESGRGEKP